MAETDQQPVVLFRETQHGLRVVACSLRATRAGVRTGMPLAEARTLVREGLFEPHDPSADRKALHSLCEWCRRYSPSVGVEPAGSEDSPESLVLDTTGCDHLFGGEQNLLSRIVSELRQQGLRSRAAVADTWGAAWATAHFTDDSIVVIAPGKQSEVLCSLPVEALRLPAAIVETLRELDLRTVGQLQALPRDSLRCRFDPVLLERMDQAAGRISETIVFDPHPQPIVATWGFEQPVSDRTWICHVLRGLVDDVAAQLATRGFGTTELACRFLHAQQERLLTVGMVRPTSCGAHLWELLSLKLELVTFGEGVSFIRVEATVVQSLRDQQQTLIDAPLRTQESGLLIERLTSRLGERAVVRPELVDEHQPELAFRLVSAIRNERQTADCRMIAAWRPPCVRRQPGRVMAVSIVPEGPPIRFQWKGCDHVIAHSWGPERIETGWWRQRHISRDYYRVETCEGRRFWLFRERASGEWFLHGSFD